MFNMKTCPNCQEFVGDSASVCFNCNYDFDKNRVATNEEIIEQHETELEKINQLSEDLHTKQKEERQMSFEEAKWKVYIKAIDILMTYIAYDDMEKGIATIKRETFCDEKTAKLIWCDLKRDYGTKETNPIIKKWDDEEKVRSYQPCCPKCGSTAIQAVRRNWSFLGGFMTDAVDRVCLNCKYKF